jgi:hypothetical protein
MVRANNRHSRCGTPGVPLYALALHDVSLPPSIHAYSTLRLLCSRLLSMTRASDSSMPVRVRAQLSEHSVSLTVY